MQVVQSALKNFIAVQEHIPEASSLDLFDPLEQIFYNLSIDDPLEAGILLAYSVRIPCGTADHLSTFQ
jgi:hypothetical protein